MSALALHLLVHKGIKDTEYLIQHLNELCWFHLAGHLCETNEVRKQDGDAGEVVCNVTIISLEPEGNIFRQHVEEK